jgi:hypothetical protein
MNYYEKSQIVYSNAMKILNDREINSANILIFCIQIMQFIETLRNLTGTEKKKIAIDVLKTIAVNNCAENKINEIMLIIEDVLPGAIDAIILIDKNKITIAKKKINILWKIISSCLP